MDVIHLPPFPEHLSLHLPPFTCGNETTPLYTTESLGVMLPTAYTRPFVRYTINAQGCGYQAGCETNEDSCCSAGARTACMWEQRRQKAESRFEGGSAATRAASVCGKREEWGRGNVKGYPATLTTGARNS